MKKLTMKTFHGFSLVEMAIVMIIIVLLMGSLLTPISTQLEQQRIKSTEKTLEEIKEALLGYAILNKRLPCPDTDTPDGKEDKNATECDSNSENYLPWIDLGVGKQDAWGNPFRYQVEAEFTKIPSIDPLDTSSGLRIKDIQGKYFTVTTGDSRVAAIIFSCGKNGRPDPTPPLPDTIHTTDSNDADGKRNTTSRCDNHKQPGAPDKTHIYDSYVEEKFDDILIWIPTYILVDRLIASGQWP